MNFSREEIFKTCVDIIEDVEKIPYNELTVKYTFFRENFPRLFETCIIEQNKNNTIKELKLLLDIREEVLEGKKETIASNIQVSEYYAKRYLYPVTGEPSIERKKKEIERIIKDNKKI